MTDGDCPLARLCAEAEGLIVRRHAAEERELKAESVRDKSAAERTVGEITTTLAHIAQRASDYRPGSADGALFAIALAVAEAERVAFCGDDRRAGEALRRLTRLLYGLRGYLEREGAMPPAVAQYYMPTPLDPHAALAG